MLFAIFISFFQFDSHKSKMNGNGNNGAQEQAQQKQNAPIQQQQAKENGDPPSRNVFLILLGYIALLGPSSW